MSAWPLARNLRGLRHATGLSVVELARRAGIGRATLTQIEAGAGNPTLDTLYALANQLHVPLAELIADPPVDSVRVVRHGTGSEVHGDVVTACLRTKVTMAGWSTEIYAVELRPGAVQHSAEHPAGVREHLHVHTGQVRVGPVGETVELGAGDYADYPADRPHRYEALEHAQATLVITGPAAG